MYYKVKKNDEIVDALENIQCVRYFPDIKRILRCSANDHPEGIISSGGQFIWHVEGWPDNLPGCDTVSLAEIGEEEYLVLSESIRAGEQIEDKPLEPDPEPDSDTLEFLKKQKIALSKSELAKYLESNPIRSMAYGNKEGVYAVTEEKQQLMALNYTTYQIKKAAGIDAVLTWNETGKECEVWTEAEFVQLIIEIEQYVKPLVAAQQSMEYQIKSAETWKEVDEIEITYGGAA